MNYRTLPYFIKIAETGSLTEAGKELGISVSALSRYVGELEKYFGMPLFQRQKQEMLLTEAGKLYYQGCRRLQKLQSKTRYEMAKLTAAGRQRLRIGLTPSGVVFLIPLYQKLMQAFPELELEIVEGYAFELLEGIRNGSIDMLFGYYHPDYLDGVEYALFFRNEIYLLVPRYHPVSASGGVDLEDLPAIRPEELRELEGMSFAYTSDETIMGKELSRALGRLDFHPVSQFRSRNAQMINFLLQTGYYAGFSYYLENVPELVYFHMPEPVYMYTAAVFPRGKAPGAAERWICARHVEVQRQVKGYEEMLNGMARRILEAGGKPPSGGSASCEKQGEERKGGEAV